MMGAEGNLPYAATRVQARHGQRVDELTWRRIETSPRLGQYFEAVRGSPLAPWVASIDPAHDVHAMERTLRSEWRKYVRLVASWHPREWQAWVDWWSWLPALLLLSRLARPEPVPAWMLADPLCGPIALGGPSERAAALEATLLRPLAAAVRGEVSIGAAWLAEAARRVPRVDAQTRESLKALLRLQARATEPTRPSARIALLRLFRAAAGSAIASGCHLALLSLELERLRGGLVVRRLFEAASSEAA